MQKIHFDKKTLEGFCETHHIIFLGLFGSVITPHFKPASDVDILVRFEPNNLPSLFEMADMEMELTKLVGRPVDLRTPNDLSPYFRDEVLKNVQVQNSR